MSAIAPNRRVEVPTMDTDFPCSRKTIRPGMPADAKAIRMLIPELHEPSVCFVATDDASRVIGAAGATRTSRPRPPVGPGIALHVIEPCRRQGIGRRLLQQLERAAQSEGAHALYGASRVEQGSDAMCGWQWLGFTPCETVETQRLPLDQFEPRLAPLVERMQNQNRIPTAARIVPLYEANKGAVLNLHLDNLGGDRADLYRK